MFLLFSCAYSGTCCKFPHDVCLIAFFSLLLCNRYGYSKERFVWSLISAVGIFCLGSGATIVHGVQNLWDCHVRYYILLSVF